MATSIGIIPVGNLGVNPRVSNFTGHKGSDRAFTELVKRYFHGTPWEHKREVVEAIPSLDD